MKALVVIGNNDYMALEEAVKRNREQGYEIFFLLCGPAFRGCNICSCCDRATCVLCTHTMRKLIRPLVKSGQGFHLIEMPRLLTPAMKEEAASFELAYTDVASLKALTFHDVEIGYGAFSTFVTYTRNVMPTFNDTLKSYLDTLMRSEIRQTLVLETLFEELKPDLVVFHNGRFANYKPIYNLARSRGIRYVATEQGRMPDGEMRKNNFENDIPHSFDAVAGKVEIAWKNAGEKGPEIGRSFFENRRNAKYAGDKIYTKDQKAGTLPEGFDAGKRNIAIFNSSEDEFFSISRDYDASVLFPNQFVALRTIFEHYKDDPDIHFYLRIHPNLKSVPWKSHTMLYELKYPNVTIIPPTSPISSYTLMDNAEKVIVFNSTMGLESSYWGKAVIALSRCSYSDYKLVYSPTDEKSVYALIDNPQLPPLQNRENCYKMACYLLRYAMEPYRYYPLTTRMLAHSIEVIPLFKLLGSPRLYAYACRLLRKMSTLIGSGRKFRKLAERTA